jgi:hypothetical protein
VVVAGQQDQVRALGHQAVYRLALVLAHLLALDVRDQADPQRPGAGPLGRQRGLGALELEALGLDEARVGADRGEQ